MEDVLERLIKIEDLDEEIKKNEQLLKHIPEKINSLQKEIERKNSQLNQAKKRLVEIKKMFKMKEGDIAENESKINKLNQQINTVKTNDEYRAIRKEIEFLINAKRESEDKMLALLEEEEMIQNSINALEKETKEFVERKKAEINELIKQKDATADVQNEKRFMFRDEINKLPEEIRKIYERINKARERPICIVNEDGVCTGCFSNITAQILNELKRKARLILCDNCGRILVYGK